MNDDLEQIIADSVNDSITGEDVTPEVDSSVETPSEPVEAPVEASETPEAPAPEESAEVPSPAKQEAPEATPTEEQDPFAKLAGVPQMGVGGRENRIPYSRVKKITQKAVGELAEAALGRKLAANEDPHVVVKDFVKQIPEMQTKITEYETHLNTVSQFEDVMANDPDKFLTMLEKLPAYAGFFQFVRAAAAQQEQDQPQETAQPTPPADPNAGMPEPDEELPDGSKVYSLNGLQKLLDWKGQQTETKLLSAYEAKLKEIDERYKPLRSEWEEHHRRQAVLPQIKKQLEEARNWAMFNESEEEILEVLRKDPQISLEGAYRQVVFPKLVADRNRTRQEILQELKTAPAGTAVPARAATKPNPPSTAAGSGDLEAIIREQIANIKR